MSVILDALHKARGDKKKSQVEPHPNSVAKVLETVEFSPGHEPAPARPRTSWVVPVVVILAGIVFLAAAGGAFFLLYDQVRRLEPTQNTPGLAAVPPSMPAASAAAPSLDAELAAPPAGALPPPTPLSELPVQPPAPVQGATPDAPASNPAAVPAGTTVNAAPAGAVAPAAPAATQPQFKLGSIVCEDNECLALLNGRTVRVGDKIRNFAVTEITATNLTLRNTTTAEEITLDLYN